MREILIGKKKAADDPRHLWEQLCTLSRSTGAQDRAAGRAYYWFREIAGTAPPKGWDFSSTPNVPVTRTVSNKIQSMRIAYAKSMALRAAA